IPESWDGMSLIPWLVGDRPSSCRTHVFSEIDLANPIEPTRYQRQLGLEITTANLAVLRTARCKLVHFNGGLPPLLFDLANDPGELVNRANDPDYANELLNMIVRMLDHRMSHADQTLSRMAVTSEGVKSAPPRKR
ncbi:MAG: phosphonate monoester hydrolase, partial [Hyphomicrobiaceae bacterium]